MSVLCTVEQITLSQYKNLMRKSNSNVSMYRIKTYCQSHCFGAATTAPVYIDLDLNVF